MPSSYTSSLRLVLPVTGELTGTWGDTVNNGLTQLVEAAIAGTAAVTMTDANYTLSTANEAADEARCMFISLSGGSLTASRDVVCPSVSKLYVVVNGTTGGQSIVFKTAAGTGVTIPNGQRALLYCDGTNVELANGMIPLPATGTQSAVLQALGALGAQTQAKSGAYTVIETDRGDALFCTGTFTLDLTAAATLGNGFSFGVVNVGAGVITIEPAGAETIDGSANKALQAGQGAFVVTDGVSWRTVGAGTQPDASDTVKGIVELATAAEFNTGTDTGRIPAVDVLRSNSIVQDTATTFSTQTAIDSASIPSWVKRIHVVLHGLSTNGTSLPIIQLADAGGVEKTGYLGAVSTVSGTGSASVNHNTGFALAQAVAGATIMHGVVTLSRVDSGGTTWAISGTLGNSNAAATQVIGGVKVLSAQLTSVRLTTVNETDQFDNTGSGQVNFMWE